MATITSSTVPAGWAPDATIVAPRDLLPGALPLVATRVAADVPGDAVSVRAIWAPPSAAQEVPEGECLTCDAEDLAETIIQTVKLGVCLPISFEQASRTFDGHSSSELLADAARAGLLNAVNAAFLTRPAPGPNSTGPTGLLNTPGLPNGGNVGPCLDRLIDAQTAIAEAGGRPDTVILSPAAWGALQSLKSGAGSCVPLLPVGADTAPVLLGCRVEITNAMPGNAGLMLDSRAVLAAIGEIRVFKQFDARCDRYNLAAYWRVGWAATDIHRLATFTVEPAQAARTTPANGKTHPGAKTQPEAL